MRKTLLLLAVVLTGHYVSYSQSTCAQTLRLAQSVYDQGRLHELPQLLEGCLSNGFSNTERANAYKLLTLTYIYLEEPEKADEAMLNLLRTNHEFAVNEAVDPAEFVALYRTFRTMPIYRIGVNIGVNATQPNVVSTFQTVSGAESEFKYKIGFQVGAAADVPVNDKLTLNGGLRYQQKSFEMTSKHDQGDGDVNQLTLIEKQSWLSLPLGVQYKVMNKSYNPFVSAGVLSEYMLSGNVSAERLREDETSVEPKTFELKAIRNKVNVSAYLGGGIKSKIGGGFFVAEVKYIYGLTKINDESSAYSNQDLYFSYGLPNTIFKLNSLSFTLGYVYNIYNPQKLKIKK